MYLSVQLTELLKDVKGRSVILHRDGWKSRGFTRAESLAVKRIAETAVLGAQASSPAGAHSRY